MFQHQYCDLVRGKLSWEVVKPVLWESIDVCATKLRQVMDLIISEDLDPALGVLETRRIVKELVKPLDDISNVMRYLAEQTDPDRKITVVWKLFDTDACDVAAVVTAAYRLVEAAELNTFASIWRFARTKKGNFVCQSQFSSSYPRILCKDEGVGDWVVEWIDDLISLSRDINLLQGRPLEDSYFCRYALHPDSMALASAIGCTRNRCGELLTAEARKLETWLKSRV